jgi:hypothetical protein
MAEIKKIKLGSTTYDIRDASADSRLTELEGKVDGIESTPESINIDRPVAISIKGKVSG